MTARDAPDRLWSVRAVVPSDLSGHQRVRDGTWEPCIYVASKREASCGGFHVWKPAAPITTQACATQEDAREAGAALPATRGLMYDATVHAFGLAPRLSDIVTDPGRRAQVRLGFGWQYALLLKRTETRRGERFSYALAEHNASKTSAHQNNWKGVAVHLVEHLGRLNATQAETLNEFRASFGIPIIGLSYMPRSSTKPIPARHLPKE